MGLFNLTLGAASTGDSGSPDPNNTPPTEPTKPPCDFNAEVNRNYHEMLGYWVANPSDDATGWNTANADFWSEVQASGGDCSKLPTIDENGEVVAWDEKPDSSGSGSGSGGGGSGSGGGGGGGGGGSGEAPKETTGAPKEGGGGGGSGGGGGDDQGKNNACIQQIDMMKAKFQADFAALPAEAKTIAAPFTAKFQGAQVYDPKDPCKAKEDMQKVYDGMTAAVAALPPKGVDVPTNQTDEQCKAETYKILEDVKSTIASATGDAKLAAEEYMRNMTVASGGWCAELPQLKSNVAQVKQIIAAYSVKQPTPPTGVDSPAPAPTPTAPTPTAPAPTPTAPAPTPTAPAPTPTAPLKPASSIDPASKPVGTVDPVFDAGGNKIGQCTYGVDQATGNRTAQVETTNPTTGAKTSVLLTKNQKTGEVTGKAAQGNGQTTTTTTSKVDGKKVAVGVGLTALAIAAFNSAGASGGRKK